MNYHQPRQLEATGRWNMSTRNDDSIWTARSCQGHAAVGHETAVEASRCFYDYELNEHPVLWHSYSDWTRCAAAVGDDHATTRGFRIGMYLFDGIAACDTCVPNAAAARVAASRLRPFTGVIQIAASW